ncbi:MAG TPA: rhodanese-like domain-containing protein [Candidatus Xenobia bacterium]|nr:rhodanese-like domain-containing protein [Candidatus Xenobia bacterium]
MILHQRFVPGLAIASYLIGDEATGEAAVVDPTRDVDDFIAFASENGLRISHIFETHVHADFVCGSRELKARLNGSPTIHASAQGGAEWTPDYVDHAAKEGDALRLGSIRLEAVHMPGHTPEHMCWATYDETRSRDLPWMLFSGDFLFVGDVGRPDLLGEEAQRQLAHQLYTSLFEKLDRLPDITEVLPAHGAGSLCGKALSSRRNSTIGFERRFNPALARKPEEQWVRDLMAGMPPAPPYFRRMKKVNKEGPAVLGRDLKTLERCAPREVEKRLGTDGLIVDTRSKEAFAAAHIPGAISIPFGPNLPTWAGWVLPYDRPLLVVTDGPGQVAPVATHLSRVGFDNLVGCLDGDLDAWEMAGLPLSSLTLVSARELDAQWRARRNEMTVLDVRTDGEWMAGHIDGALHIPVGHVLARLAEVPRGKPLAVVCGSGYRGSIVGSLLQREGFENVSNLVGGMGAWRAAGLPVTTR